jgi:hypothetical protein
MMSLRFEGPPEVHEKLVPMGFGRCAMSPDAIRRREGKRPERGPEHVPDPEVGWLNSDTFGMHASICPGDSGGPVIARGSHEVVGVISHSAMDGDETTNNASVMVRVDAFRSLFGRARQIADGTPASELPPVACR